MDPQNLSTQKKKSLFLVNVMHLSPSRRDCITVILIQGLRLMEPPHLEQFLMWQGVGDIKSFYPKLTQISST